MRNAFFVISSLGILLLAGCREKPTVNATPANLSLAIATAKAENKLLLLEFGSSDACPPCMALEEKVFSQSAFKDYATSNLVFIRLDFPDKSKLPADVMATNLVLASQFNAYGFPTFIGLNHDGKEIWRQEGVTLKQIDPKEFIALIESAKSQQK